MFALWKSRLYTVPAAMAITGGMILVSVFRAWVRPSDAFQFRWLQRWSRVLLGFIGVRVHVYGTANAAPGTAYLVVANHASLMDIPVLSGALPLHLRFMAKRELRRVPLLGQYIEAGGHLTVDRRDARRAFESLEQTAQAIRSRHLTPAVFPEGTRSNGDVQRFKDGAAYMAIKAGVPVLPVGVWGTQFVLPNRSSLLQGGDVVVVVGEPVPTVGLEPKHRRQLTERLEIEVRKLHDAAQSHYEAGRDRRTDSTLSP